MILDTLEPLPLCVFVFVFVMMSEQCRFQFGPVSSSVICVGLSSVEVDRNDKYRENGVNQMSRSLIQFRFRHREEMVDGAKVLCKVILLNPPRISHALSLLSSLNVQAHTQYTHVLYFSAPPAAIRSQIRLSIAPLVSNKYDDHSQLSSASQFEEHWMGMRWPVPKAGVSPFFNPQLYVQNCQ